YGITGIYVNVAANVLLSNLCTAKINSPYSTDYNFTAFKARESSLVEQLIIKNLNKTKNYLTG
ncbi:hypothetical protein, partial [Gilliamella sp. Pas-s95]|uniref:hypothetical protein n=1 Tax=Gilliamella sp. Pas-s95 TaxID=2687317 RepID=UPI001F2319A9